MKGQQSTSTILMVRPKAFAFNTETANTNKFQERFNSPDLHSAVLAEFDEAVDTIRKAGVIVLVEEDRSSPVCPDAIFPNNWFSTHQDGSIIIYPMYSSNRQAEVRQDIINRLSDRFNLPKTIDLRANARKMEALEGTGSLVLDRVNRRAYACISERTSVKLANDFCEATGYQLITFNAEINGVAIYHTNVLMSISTDFNFICSEAIVTGNKEDMLDRLDDPRRQTIEISKTQLHSFLGNVLEVESITGQKILVISQTAFNSLTAAQKKLIYTHLEFVVCNIPLIEKIGGGSIRCMIAEIYCGIE